ncbi:hypothetical protein [Actinoplanes utahensis]|uniref:Uncharacterized protein n=1 Tax=Actinoplanes utahensis TaxID=1869 RepID=A0A0A6UMI8_ACTUT|nr:hypothetical protein [Actinoplanes utahensis]KHD77320.1 hypothetical protein MB27_11110 [Actinoplanes utahensis]GIF32956.1 hypothetical protein Aut01nite_59420 [Actinoplanes utahensis]
MGRPRIVVAAAVMLAGGGALIVAEAWRAAERMFAGLAFEQQMQGWQESDFGLVRAVGAANAGVVAVDLASAATRCRHS